MKIIFLDLGLIFVETQNPEITLIRHSYAKKGNWACVYKLGLVFIQFLKSHNLFWYANF